MVRVALNGSSSRNATARKPNQSKKDRSPWKRYAKEVMSTSTLALQDCVSIEKNIEKSIKDDKAYNLHLAPFAPLDTELPAKIKTSQSEQCLQTQLSADDGFGSWQAPQLASTSLKA